MMCNFNLNQLIVIDVIDSYYYYSYEIIIKVSLSEAPSDVGVREEVWRR